MARNFEDSILHGAAVRDFVQPRPRKWPGGTQVLPRLGLAGMTEGKTPGSADVMHIAPAMPENSACIKPRPAFEFARSLG